DSAGDRRGGAAAAGLRRGRSRRPRRRAPSPPTATSPVLDPPTRVLRRSARRSAAPGPAPRPRAARAPGGRPRHPPRSRAAAAPRARSPLGGGQAARRRRSAAPRSALGGGGPPPWWSQSPRAPALRRARRRAPRRRATDVAPAPAVCLAPERLAGEMVGVTGFEPAAPASRTQCSTRLSYTPCKAGQRVRARLTQALRQEKLAADGCDVALRRDASSPATSGEFPSRRRARRRSEERRVG